MEPEPVAMASPTTPSGNWFRRGSRAAFVERRLPTRIEKAIDRLCVALGRDAKIVTAGDLKFKVRRFAPDEHFVRDVVERREYNPPGYEIGEADTVIDVGANVGAFALLAARQAPRGRVIALEPVAGNYDLLIENVSLNGVENVFPRRAAVLDESGRTRVYLHPDSAGAHSVLEYRGPEASRYETVDALTLADVFDAFGVERCDFLKLDCEGAEYRILYSAPGALLARVGKIALEYHATSAADKRIEAGRLVDYLQDSGFRIDAYLDYVGLDYGMIRARRG